jgi:hypothetical protein
MSQIQCIDVHSMFHFLYALIALWKECQFMTCLLIDFKTANIYLYSFTIISAYKHWLHWSTVELWRPYTDPAIVWDTVIHVCCMPVVFGKCIFYTCWFVPRHWFTGQFLIFLIVDILSLTNHIQCTNYGIRKNQLINSRGLYSAWKVGKHTFI